MNVAKETFALYEDDKILNMLEEGRLVSTNEDVSEFSYKGKRVFVPNNYLGRIMPKVNYNENTIGAILPGLRAGVIVNSYSPSKIGPSPSSYAPKLSQTKEEKDNYKSLYKPIKPRRLFD